MCCMINTQVDWQPSPWFFQTPKTNTSDFPGQRRGARHSGVLVQYRLQAQKIQRSSHFDRCTRRHHMLSLGTHASRPDQREWWKLGILWNSQISLWKNIWIPWKNIKQHPFGFWKISNLFHFQAEFGPCLAFMVFMCISNSLYSGLLLAPAASNASLACWKLAATDLPATGKTDVLFLLSL